MKTRKLVERRVASLLLYIAMVLASSVGYGQTFGCDSDLYQILAKELKVLDPQTGTYTLVGSSSQSYNGAGFNYEDGYIYGMVSTDNSMVRVDNTGASTNLGVVSGFNARHYTGDLDISGNWYSMTKTSGTWILNTVDVSESPLIAVVDTLTQISGAETPQASADIVYNATFNKFYSMQAGILSEIDHVNKTIKGLGNYSDAADDMSGSFGAAWSDNQGNLYFFHNNTGNIFRVQLDVSGEVSSFALTATSTPNGNNDGISCPMANPPVFPEICNNGIDDDLDGLTDCEDPDCYLTENCGVTAYMVNSDEACAESIATFHTFYTNNSNLGNTVTVSATLPTGYVYLQDTIEFDQGGSSDFTHQPTEGDTGVLQWGTISLEAYETVRISYDVTFDELSVVEGSNNTSYSATLSSVGSQLFPSSSVDVSTSYTNVCPPPQSYSCEPAFYQVYKKKGKNEPNMYGKLDPITGDYDPIAVASDYANGLGFDINTGLVYGASGKKFIELDSAGLVIDKGITFNKKVYRGDINENSEWFGVDGSDMVKIDVSGTPFVVATYAGQGLPGWDIAYNENGNFYSLHSNGDLYEFNTTTNQKTNLGAITGSGIPETGGYGAQWTGSDGYLYASHNSTGTILRVDVVTKEARKVSSSIDGLSKNDGFSCPLEIPAVYEFDYGDNSRLPQIRILSYKQDLNSDDLPDYSTVWMGNTISEDSADPSTIDADGDLDDGFGITTDINSGTINTQVDLNTNMDEVTAHYVIAIDWDDNGTLDSLALNSVAITEPQSVNELFDVPAGFIDGYINVRVVVSEDEVSSSNITGDNMSMGEAEDYRFFVSTPCEGCEVETAFTGGLESDGSIATAIAKRNYLRKVVNENRHLKINQMTRRNFERTRTSSDNGLADYLPEIGFTNNEEVTVSTPEDLVDLTNAEEVFAQDYYLGDARIAGTLVLETQDEVYNHAKIICDRLNGKQIEKVQLIEVGGIKMLYASISSGNTLEHSAWFAARTNGESYQIQSKWNIDGYEEGDFLNFQVWSSSSNQVFYIIEHILNELGAAKEVVQEESGYEIPGVIVQSGSYHDGLLELHMLNISGATETTINASIRKTELTSFEDASYSVSLTGEKYEVKYVETGHLFDVGLSIYASGNQAYDDLYLADGAWGTDLDPTYSNVNVFSIIAENNEIIENTHRVERGFEMDGESSDVINVFRNIKAGEQSLDVSAYASIGFDIYNNTPIEVVLVEKDLFDWENRRKKTIYPRSATSRVVIDLNQFEGGESETIGEVQTILFSYLNTSGSTEQVTMQVANIYFGNEAMTITSASESTNANIAAYPNPVSDYLNVSFTGKTGESYKLKVIDTSGKIVLSKEDKLTSTQHTDQVSLDNFKSGVYLVKIETGATSVARRILVK